MKKILPAIIFFYLGAQKNFCQKYNFINYNVQQGLAQSQVFDITQDQYGIVWCATLGGISRFDGTSFKNYDKTDGLLSQLDYEVFADFKNAIWVGTQDGIQSFDGRSFKTYSLPATGSKTIISVSKNIDGKIYLATADGKLYQQNGQTCSSIHVEPTNFFVSCLGQDKNRNLFAAVYKKGIYKLEKDKWILYESGLSQRDFVKRIFFDDANQLWILSNESVYKRQRQELQKISLPSVKEFYSLAEDAEGSMWIGTAKGAYLITKRNERKFIGVASGLTDNTIYNIIRDREGSMWFATDGDGLFRLSDNSFTYIDRSSGLHGNIVMAVARDQQNNFWVGSSDGGLEKYDGNSFTRYTIPSIRPESQKINCLAPDDEKLWIGTIGGGLWTLRGKSFSEVLFQNKIPVKDIASIYLDPQKTVWVTTPHQIFYWEQNVLHLVHAPSQPYFTVHALSEDSILVGSSSGLGLITKKNKFESLPVPLFSNTVITCIDKWKNYLVIGGMEIGVVLWNPATNKVFQCSRREGLSSNSIFSIYFNKGSVWVGTGHGLSKIEFNDETKTFRVRNYSFLNNPLGPECNLHAAVADSTGKIWFGTTKGVAIYNQSDTIPHKKTPLVFLNSVQLFSKPFPKTYTDTIIAWNNIPQRPFLHYDENHLTFDLSGIYFTDATSVRYRYKLDGIDTAYCDLTPEHRIIYSSLAPGSYIFRAYAVTINGVSSENSIEFPFEIAAPLYEKQWFRIAMAIALIGIGILIQHTRTKIKRRRLEMINLARMEEQEKIRQRASEDLHDDLGNKITRISVLTDILQTKIEKNDLQNQQLISKVKENVMALYAGTKDIIWSMHIEGDNLEGVLERIELFGASLFENTSIQFSIDQKPEGFKQIRFSPETARNLILILKEALHNILKHSGGTMARISVLTSDDYSAERTLQILVTDNGKGILQPSTQGTGLENIRKRAERIKGKLAIHSDEKGTVLIIEIKIPTTKKFENGKQAII